MELRLNQSDAESSRLPVDLSLLQKLTAPGERLAAVGWNVACSYRCEDGNIDFGGPALRPPAKLICLCRLAGLREPPSDPRLRRQEAGVEKL
jgi:hypothetical protein